MIKKTIYFFIITIPFLVGFPNAVISGTIFIPDEYPNIQDGIDAAQEGDSVVVRPGLYKEQINFKNGIYIKSEKGPLSTIIDAEDNGEVVNAFVPVDRTTILEGFTITGGTGWAAVSLGLDAAINISPTIRNNIIRNNSTTGILCHGAYTSSSPVIEGNLIVNNTVYYENGGGIRVNSSNPIIKGNIIIYNKEIHGCGGGINCYGSDNVIIKNNIINNNSASANGGGIYLQGINTLIENNKITANVADKGGGGIYCHGGYSNIIKNNLIAKNVCHSEYWDQYKDNAGGGICLSRVDSSEVVNNTIYNNRTGYGGAGIHLYVYETHTLEGPQITNNIITENENGAGIDCEYYMNNYPIISYNDVWGNELGDYSSCEPGFGDISEDPLFIYQEKNDCRLLNSSPCIDAGDPELYDPDQTRSDMGYYYFNQEYPVLFYFTPHDFIYKSHDTGMLRFTFFNNSEDPVVFPLNIEIHNQENMLFYEKERMINLPANGTVQQDISRVISFPTGIYTFTATSDIYGNDIFTFLVR